MPRAKKVVTEEVKEELVKEEIKETKEETKEEVKNEVKVFEVVNCNKLRVRKEANIESEQVGLVDNGDVFEISKIENGFGFCEKVNGFLLLEFLKESV